jgi:pyruvate ferredoxin oxidoreductase delta subunit
MADINKTKRVTKPEGELTWKDLEMGCIVTDAGNASQYRTGDWKSERPILDKTKCIKCGLCYLYCPEGCIQEDAEGYFVADLFYCKGCGICYRECWPRAIKMAPEEE